MKQAELSRRERQVMIGMIASTEYLQDIEPILNLTWVQSREAVTIMTWILEHYDKYHKAPGSLIQEIYYKKLRKKKISGAQAEVIEEALESLSMEAQEWDDDDLQYQIDSAVEYCQECQLQEHGEQIQNLTENGDREEALILTGDFTPVDVIRSEGVIPFATDEQRVNMFKARGNSLIEYPGDLGNFLNPYMIKSAFVVYLAQNKGGKSFNLMDAALRAGAQGRKTLLIQAGDMTQEQMELRMAIYICQLSDQEMYCNKRYIPILDCVHNQLGSCELDIRNNDDEGPFETEGQSWLESDMHYTDLTGAIDHYPRHKPCYECLRQKNRAYTDFKGTIWYKIRPKTDPLDLATFNSMEKMHKKKFNSYFKAIQNIRLFSYSSDGMSMSIMERQYNILAKEGFEGEVVIADYLDLYAPDKLTGHMQPRDQENQKWKRGRRFSQEYGTLFISASQSDAQGFDATLLSKKNFSEDRRKLDHVTGMIGLNMTTREKRLGLMRMNEIASRDTDGTKVINIMHRLQIGRPILGSFF